MTIGLGGIVNTSAFRHTLDELENALGCKISRKKVWEGPTPRSNGKWVLKTQIKPEDSSFYLLFERGVDFSPKEKDFVNLVLKSHRLLSTKAKSRGVAYQYLQASITASVMDIAVSRFIAKSRENFLNTHTLIQYFKRLSFERYEGEQVKTGILVMKNPPDDNQDFKTENMIYEHVSFDDLVRISPSILSDTAFFRYVDGLDSVYCCDNYLNVHGYINILNDNHDVFNKLSGSRIEYLIDEHDDVYFYIGITNKSDIEIYFDDTFRIIFRRGKWFFIDSEILNVATTDLEIQDTQIDPWRIIYSLSKIRKGAAILCVDDSKSEQYKQLTIGHVTKEEDMFNAVQTGITNCSLEKLCITGELIRVLTTDGMTIFDEEFSRILDFTVIVDTSSDSNDNNCKEKGGGGRTTAVCASSKYGIATKVSEDGPISAFYDGDELYKVG